MQEYLKKMKKIQSALLEYLDDEENDDERENYQNLIQTIDSTNIQNDKIELKSFLILLSKISENRNQHNIYIQKVSKIIFYLKNNIEKFISNIEKYNIFKYNPKIIVFLIENEILINDKIISSRLLNSKYCYYYYPEIKELIDNRDRNKYRKPSQNLPKDFLQKRKNNDLDDYILKLIKEDSLDDFIIYINETNYPYKDQGLIVYNKGYDKNLFLMDHIPSLIEYAALFGSFRIYQYLKMKKVELKSSIWIYAINGGNPEIIQDLEESKIFPDLLYNELVAEAIKCHHNEIANYIIDNYIKNYDINLKTHPKQILKYYNFEFMDEEYIDESLFFDCCKWNHLLFVKYILENNQININKIFSRDYITQDGSKTYNYPCYERITALHYAVKKENCEMVQYLLSNENIDVNILYKYVKHKFNYALSGHKIEKTALHLAVEKENLSIVKLLLSCKNIDTNIYYINDNNSCPANHVSKYTCLHLAVVLENIEIVNELLKNKNIDVNLYQTFRRTYPCDNSGHHLYYTKTALYMAIEKENIDIIRLLFSIKNIDVNIPYIFVNKDSCKAEGLSKKQTVLDLAIEKNRNDIIQILKNKNAVSITKLKSIELNDL